MSWGGARSGAGRPLGATNKRTKEAIARASEQGVLPLDVMLSLLQESWEHLQFLREQIVNAPNEEKPALKTLLDVREQCFMFAKDSAPYCHPRLSQNKTEQSTDGPFQIVMQPEDKGL